MPPPLSLARLQSERAPAGGEAGGPGSFLLRSVDAAIMLWRRRPIAPFPYFPPVAITTPYAPAGLMVDLNKSSSFDEPKAADEGIPRQEAAEVHKGERSSEPALPLFPLYSAAFFAASALS
jgi:hypothetical protein